MKTIPVTPPYLQPGDTVGICCLAYKLTYDDIAAGVKLLESWGLRVLIGETVGAEDRQFGGSDALRIQDFQQMLDNPQVKAIFSARGGYGTTRILDKIDFAGLQRNPKWIIGYSDITALLCHLLYLGHESLHATMPKLMGQPDTQEADETLRRALFGEELKYQEPSHPMNRLGAATGVLAGGNLILLDTLVNTASDLDYTGKILFLEDVGENFYNLDRVLVHLRRMGRLQKLAGLVLGQFTEMKDNTVPFGRTVEEIVLEHCAGTDFPICFDFPVGHVPRNVAMIVGREARLEVSGTGTSLTFSQGRDSEIVS
ncbi:LD-carboxypeptidase [Rufibacter sp. LB8]|uniref:S66 peptidase family protein n=1 Tax=Rufibacter sp. LB8 TaxID=2777781 RepID=UPI00178C7046|nr:LD-carboxypeptidase [Rufibacter sp. LB8]